MEPGCESTPFDNRLQASGSSQSHLRIVRGTDGIPQFNAESCIPTELFAQTNGNPRYPLHPHRRISYNTEPPD